MRSTWHPTQAAGSTHHSASSDRPLGRGARTSWCSTMAASGSTERGELAGVDGCLPAPLPLQDASALVTMETELRGEERDGSGGDPVREWTGRSPPRGTPFPPEGTAARAPRAWEFIGFRTLHFVGPCVTVFGLSPPRFDGVHPYYASGRSRPCAAWVHGHDGRRSRLTAAANRGAREVAAGPSAATSNCRRNKLQILCGV